MAGRGVEWHVCKQASDPLHIQHRVNKQGWCYFRPLARCVSPSAPRHTTPETHAATGPLSNFLHAVLIRRLWGGAVCFVLCSRVNSFSLHFVLPLPVKGSNYCETDFCQASRSWYSPFALTAKPVCISLECTGFDYHYACFWGVDVHALEGEPT